MHLISLFNSTDSGADNACMGRLFSYVFLLAALAVGGYLVMKSAQDTGPASPQFQQAQDAANQVSASVNLQQATPVLEEWYDQRGTYAGAQVALPPAFRVTLVRADSVSYCVQAGTGANVQHMNGPNENAPIAGPC